MRPSAIPMSVSSLDCRSASRTLRMMRSIAFPACTGPLPVITVQPLRPGSLAAWFDVDVRGFYDRPPLLDLSFVVCAERFRRLLLRRRDHLAQVLKPVADILVRECVHGRVCKCLDNILWRTFRHPQAGPR